MCGFEGINFQQFYTSLPCSLFQTGINSKSLDALSNSETKKIRHHFVNIAAKTKLHTSLQTNRVSKNTGFFKKKTQPICSFFKIECILFS